MSDKVRVMFEVPPGTKHRDRLSKPVEIPIEKYIEFKMGMRDGYNGEMAAYVGETFLKGTVVSSDEIKMITAVGNSQALLDIDAQIARGENPLANAGKNSPRKESGPNALDKLIARRYPKWLELKQETREWITIGGALLVVFILIAILIICLGDPEPNEHFQQMHDWVKNVSK